MLINLQVIILLPLLTFPSSVVLGVSFDCEKASNKIEKSICENSELSRLDDELDIYKKLRNTNVNKIPLKKKQRLWLKVRSSWHLSS